MRNVVMALGLLLALAAQAQEEALAELQLGPVVARVQQGAVLYLALDRGGVAVVDVADPAHPRLVGRLLEGQHVGGLLLDKGQLIALELREEVHRFALTEPLRPVAARLGGAALTTPVSELSVSKAAPGPRSPADAAPAEGAPPAAPASGRIVEIRDGRIIFAGGTSRGFTKGSRVRVVSQQLVEKPDLTSDAVLQVASGEVTAVVAVEQADAERGMAQLGRGDLASVGDLVELTSEPLSERLALPRRAPYLWRFGFHARPFLGLASSSKPVGLLTDAFVAATAPTAPFTIAAAIEPLGLAFNSNEAHFPMSASLLGAYTTDFFEVGLGLGTFVGAGGQCFGGRIDSSGRVVDQTCPETSGLTVNQTLRLGALDGLHFEWHSSIFSRASQFAFGTGRGELAVPLTSRLSLFGAGGGGGNGFAFGEVGVRTFLSGTGAPGTVILSASLGYASVFDGPRGELVGGPSVAFGAEWRR